MMAVIEAEGYYFPPGFDAGATRFRTEIFERDDITIRLKIPTVTRATVEVLSDYLKNEREQYLAKIPIEKVIRILDEASRRWLDKSNPYRKMALKTIPALSGFSREMVAESIKAEMESSPRKPLFTFRFERRFFSKNRTLTLGFFTPHLHFINVSA